MIWAYHLILNNPSGKLILVFRWQDYKAFEMNHTFS